MDASDNISLRNSKWLSGELARQAYGKGHLALLESFGCLDLAPQSGCIMQCL